jgi:hypothetical protein
MAIGLDLIVIMPEEQHSVKPNNLAFWTRNMTNLQSSKRSKMTVKKFSIGVVAFLNPQMKGAYKNISGPL